MKILFQGDSITDAGRNYQNDLIKGFGYATLVSAELGFDYVGKYEFINRGISGNRIVDLYARIKKDIINIKPDIMSILIGVNDVWHESMEFNGVDAEKFEKIYNMLIEEVKTALPDIKIMILEPFALKGTATEEQWDLFRSEVEKRANVAKSVAEKNKLIFVPLMDKFDNMDKVSPANYLTWEGVHPTLAGHELIKREWIKAFKQHIDIV